MSTINEDVLWLESLVKDNNYSMAQLTISSNTSSFSLPILTTSSTVGAILFNQNRLFLFKWFVRIIGGLLIIVGGIGNTLSALTLSRKKLRAQVTSIYLIALALSDLGNVFFSVLNFYIIRYDPNRNMRLFSNVSCKLHIFFTYYFINLSPTLLVAVSVQRYLAIAKNQYSRKHCTVKNAYIVISIICLISFFIQLHWGIFYELRWIPIKTSSTVFNRTISYRRICNISTSYPSYLWFRSNILGYIQWFFFTLCPFIIMLILNCLILQVIASARRIQQRMNQKNQRKKAKQRNMTIMLLSVSCVFILLTAPASTFMAFGHLFKNLHGPSSQTLWTMFSLIYYANTAANFLLYFLTANVFRQELRVMILSLPGCAKLLPEQCELMRGDTIRGIERGKFATIRRTQCTTVPVLTSVVAPTNKKLMNGINRKSSSTNLLSVHSNTRLLSTKNPLPSSSGTSQEDESRL